MNWKGIQVRFTPSRASRYLFLILYKQDETNNCNKRMVKYIRSNRSRLHSSRSTIAGTDYQTIREVSRNHDYTLREITVAVRTDLLMTDG
jgi:hypothetical protein